MSAITLVITSCGRWDLLARTLESLAAHADMPFARTIITEDSGRPLPLDVRPVADVFGTLTVLDGVPNVGQIASIDRAYALVDTPYVFHCEDDWEFYRTGFLGESMDVLEVDPRCINHWLRERDDINGHPLDGDRVRPGYNHLWYGFTFNPTLKRMADYRAIGSYGAVHPWDRRDPGRAESMIGRRYHELGYHATIAWQGYVRHTGGGRHVH